MRFFYKAKTEKGVIENGYLEAPDQISLEGILRERKQTLVFVREEKKLAFFDITTLNNMFVFVKLHDKIIFTRNLSVMLSAGLPLARSLSILGKQTKNYKFKIALDSLLEDINSGMGLSDGMKKFPAIFSNLFVSMVKAGEESGSLPQALRSVGEQLDRTYTINRKVRGALTYPAIILIAIFGIAILMLIYVVPTITKTFADLHVELPGSTQFIINISSFLVNHTTTFILGLAGFIMAAYFAIKSRRGGIVVSFIAMKFPVIGTIVQEFNSARAARTLSSLFSSGVPVQQAISIAADVMQNVYFKAVLVEAGEKVEKGATLSSVFKSHSNLYPVIVGEMIEVGEETGKLAEMLMNVAVFYEEEVEAATKDLSTIIEPLLMIVIGAAVGFFAVSMITPMYSVMSGI
ncbi:MAG: type II secretion system F family protein [Candidatus Paceibacterota bacterium]|jgi:type IV pilus assembly protein PilC